MSRGRNIQRVVLCFFLLIVWWHICNILFSYWAIKEFSMTCFNTQEQEQANLKLHMNISSTLQQIPLTQTKGPHPEEIQGALIRYKISSCQYSKSSCGDETVVGWSYLHNGISYIVKMTSLYYKIVPRRQYVSLLPGLWYKYFHMRHRIDNIMIADSLMQIGTTQFAMDCLESLCISFGLQ